MAEEASFKCLRCGHEFTAPYSPKVIEERACPQCASNSVRRLKEKVD
jgi:DNA-directed RNA polymerase subunit RPC12/RpoP